MTIKSIKEKYKDYRRSANEKNMFAVCDYGDGNGKVVIVVLSHPCKYVGKYVHQVVRVRDGKELLSEGSMRPCDDLEDAIDVAGEMLDD